MESMDPGPDAVAGRRAGGEWSYLIAARRLAGHRRLAPLGMDTAVHASNASAALASSSLRILPGSACKYLGVEVINNTGINKQALPSNNSERGTGQNRAADALLAWMAQWHQRCGFSKDEAAFHLVVQAGPSQRQT